MFCPNCGNKLEDDDKFCGSCGSRRGEMPSQNGNVATNLGKMTMTKEDEKNANILALISLILCFGLDTTLYAIGIVIPAIQDLSVNTGLLGFFPLIGFVLIIIARVKYPKSKLVKVVMWIYIILFIIAILTIALLLVTCIGICSNIPA